MSPSPSLPKRAASIPPARPRTRLPFAAGALLGLLGVLLAGWFTPLRGVMHGLLITLGAAAPIPLVLVLGVVALFATAGLATALVAEEAAVSVASAEAARQPGGALAQAYFAHVRRQRRQPFAWAAAAGVGLGIVGLWLVLAALVIPLDTHTLGALLLASARIDAAAERGSAPPSSPDGLLRPSAWHAPAAEGDAPLHDAFGHPLALASSADGYTLRSPGLDGVPSGDDLCISGPIHPTRTPAVVRDPLGFVERLRDGQLGWPERLEALAQTHCPR